MNIINKTVAILICLLVVAFLFGCKGKGDKGDESTTSSNPAATKQSETVINKTAAEITVGYVKSDSFNPYKLKSVVNEELMYLLHAGLFQLDKDLSVTAVIAKSYNINGKTIEVEIKENAVFSDNTPINASHIALSFKAAKASPSYLEPLKGIRAVEEVSAKRVRFLLSDNDVYALNLLTFPIIKSNDSSPKGAGKYSLEYKDNKPYLKLNNHSPLYSISRNNEIKLYDVSQGVNEQYAFMTHKTSVHITTLDDYEYNKLSPKTAPVETTKLVFIGINGKSGITSWQWLKRAVNIGVNRTKVSGAPLLGQSLPASTPFHPLFFALNGLEVIDFEGDKARAIKIIEENGFNAKDSSGYRKKGNLTLSLSVLVCSDNPLKVDLAKAFVQDMKEIGIKASITEKEYDDYLALLKSGKFDFYIGEINLCPNFALDSFFEKGGAASFGISDKSQDDYFSFKRGKITIGAYIESFYTDVPFIPLCYRRSVMSYDKTITGVETAFKNPYNSVYLWATSE